MEKLLADTKLVVLPLLKKYPTSEEDKQYVLVNNPENSKIEKIKAISNLIITLNFYYFKYKLFDSHSKQIREIFFEYVNLIENLELNEMETKQYTEFGQQCKILNAKMAKQFEILEDGNIDKVLDGQIEIKELNTDEKLTKIVKEIKF